MSLFKTITVDPASTERPDEDSWETLSGHDLTLNTGLTFWFWVRGEEGFVRFGLKTSYLYPLRLFQNNSNPRQNEPAHRPEVWLDAERIVSEAGEPDRREPVMIEGPTGPDDLYETLLWTGSAELFEGLEAIYRGAFDQERELLEQMVEADSHLTIEDGVVWCVWVAEEGRQLRRMEPTRDRADRAAEDARRDGYDSWIESWFVGRVPETPE